MLIGILTVTSFANRAIRVSSLPLEVERYEDTVVENEDLDIDGYEAVKDPDPEEPAQDDDPDFAPGEEDKTNDTSET